MQTREALGMAILRIGLAWFLFVWAVNKILAPAQYQKIWGYFYGIDIGANMPYILAAAQIAICLAIALGLWRVVSYASALPCTRSPWRSSHRP